MKSHGFAPRSRIIASAALVCVFALAGCGSSSSETSASSEGLPGSIKVSVIVPTTGPLATFGQQVVAGVNAGVAEIEKSGDLGNSKLEISFADTASQAATAASLTQSATRDGTVAIIGSPISNEALAAGPVANSASIPYLATAAPGPQLPALGEYVYSMTTPQKVQLASYVTELVKKAPKVTVIFASDNETTVNLNESLKESIPAAGGTLVDSISTTLTATDSRVVATKAMEGSPDAVGVMSGGPQLPALVSELRGLGYKGTIFANEGAQVSAPAAGAAVDGLEFQGQWVAGVEGELSKSFADAIAITNPEITPAYSAVDGFNSIRYIVEGLLKANSTDGEKLVAALQDVGKSGFQSPGGEVTFTGEGNRQLESPTYFLVVNGGVVSLQK